MEHFVIERKSAPPPFAFLSIPLRCAHDTFILFVDTRQWVHSGCVGTSHHLRAAAWVSFAQQIKSKKLGVKLNRLICASSRSTRLRGDGERRLGEH